MKKIMVVDDAEDIRQVLKLYLKNAGYQVIEAANGREALKLLESESISLMILDIMMPVMDGFEVIKALGKTRAFPVIFLSARSAVQDKIQGLNLGADDYMEKPFDPGELLARVMAVLRRSGGSQTPSKKTNGDLVWDLENRHIYFKGERMDLTAKEYQLLALFMERPGKVYTKREIYESLWEEPYMYDDNTIMVHISKLREKIEANPKKPEYIQTIRGIGYMMKDLGRG